MKADKKAKRQDSYDIPWEDTCEGVLYEDEQGSVIAVLRHDGVKYRVYVYAIGGDELDMLFRGENATGYGDPVTYRKYEGEVILSND